MSLNHQAIQGCLRAFNFKALFIEHLGWDKHQAEHEFTLPGGPVTLRAVAQKRGLIAFVCQGLPPRADRLALDRQVTLLAREHFIIYADQPAGQQLWQWIRREPGKPLANREQPYQVTQDARPLLLRLDHLAVSLEEEELLTLPDVTGKARAAFDVDKVTKKFYDLFKAEHAAFLLHISGIACEPDRQWYTSLMLNRLMFTYFIQKKGFLDGDLNYLRRRLQQVQALKGLGQFQSFYRYFLLCLFHDGLGKAPEDRRLDPALARLLGQVPFLNGGFFELHQLEEANPEIAIPDEAFARLFDFFDQYQWHLDERPLRKANEINPDVIGYIFEKYINQKQMGAYYTKEDITEYIGKNTIIPFLFDAARKHCAIAFAPGSALWRLLRDDPDRYIYSAVRHGVVDTHGQVLPLPPEISAGLSDISQRAPWNRPAPETHGLPTETWREYLARRQRCLDLRERLQQGQIHQINDLITYNLDLWQFARDAIVRAEGPELLRAFWRAIRELTVLDPTCGSGAFLFAALRLLESLYGDCLERMAQFLAELGQQPQHPEKYSDFKLILKQLAQHPNEQHFILKSIIIHNLYGVDIMEEAVEICKLRLFLKLVAQVEHVADLEPLPDMDFNIRAGNTLVGFASLEQVRRSQDGKLGFGKDQLQRIEEDAELVERAFKLFREQQTTHGGKVTRLDKQELRARLNKLDQELDHYLASEYGISTDRPTEFAAWKASHQPFHWLVDFFGIMHRGGFDVIVGNPPYVATSKIGYLSKASLSLKLPDLYAHVILRSISIAGPNSRFGMIVPLSITFSGDFGYLRNRLMAIGKGWYSSYDNIPAALFAGVSQRCTIWIGDRSSPMVSVSSMYRWRSNTRASLIDNVSYTTIDCRNAIEPGLPKANSEIGASLLYCLSKTNSSKARQVISPIRQGNHRIKFSQAARNFVSAFVCDPPYLHEATLENIPSQKIGDVLLSHPNHVFAAQSILIGELYFWYWLSRGDGFDVTSWIICDFIRTLDFIPQDHFDILVNIGNIIHNRRMEALAFKKNAGKYVGNYNFRGHAWITRRADLVILAGLGADRDVALEVFNYVQRVLAINEFAGEKSIPAAVKDKFPPLPPDEANEQRIFARADALIQSHFGFSKSDLDFLLYHDVTYGSGAGEAD